jgi:hypothetical protein
MDNQNKTLPQEHSQILANLCMELKGLNYNDVALYDEINTIIIHDFLKGIFTNGHVHFD